MLKRNTERRSRSAYADSTKAALITALVMGTLWILLFTVPSLFGNNDSVWQGFYLGLLFPGAIIVFPLVLVQGHSAWPGLVVIGAVFNWLLYSWLVYALIRFRRRKRDASQPPPEPEKFDYADHWQKPAAGSKP
ncbi:MAG TPA: hypothetical protein VGU63_14115 [Candidatus Acidoferrales bacterium]|nr:hypothetical protein [Candidatus Acidoferrales bacterium]